MSDLSAKHYLEIYRFRLKMAEEGIAHPKPEIFDGMRQLVARLSEMQSDELVRLDTQDGKARFSDASTGYLLFEFDVAGAA